MTVRRKQRAGEDSFSLCQVIHYYQWHHIKKLPASCWLTKPPFETFSLELDDEQCITRSAYRRTAAESKYKKLYLQGESLRNAKGLQVIIIIIESSVVSLFNCWLSESSDKCRFPFHGFKFSNLSVYIQASTHSMNILYSNICWNCKKRNLIFKVEN